MLLRKIVDDEINASQKLTELPESRFKTLSDFIGDEL